VTARGGAAGPYDDARLAALYDLFYGDYDDDVALYESFARRGETPVLELGIGSGRVALRLARAGIDVVGIDSSPHMLARLRAALDAEPPVAKRVRALQADLRDFSVGERFDLVFCAANTFQHLLTTDDQVATLRCIAAHLSDGGIFVTKLQSPRAVDWGAEGGGLQLQPSKLDPATGEIVMRFAARLALPASMCVRNTRIYDRIAADGSVRRSVMEYTLKYMTADELRLVLDAAGMRLLHLYGDHDLSPFTEDSDSMIIVGGAREG
jgi:SAM-dependent methyltransferase